MEKAQFAMQRRSGGMKSAPDAFVITSLDVLIHRHKKIGEGGFGQVYEAEWQGSCVAVKVLEKNVSRMVSAFHNEFILVSTSSTCRSLRRRLTSGRDSTTPTFCNSLVLAPLPILRFWYVP
jgi:serine/threonine protein kinase